MSESTATRSGHTARVCAFAAETTVDDLPPDVVEHAKRMLVDTVAVTLAGVDTEPATIARSVFTGAGASGLASIIGTGKQGRPGAVAHCLGTAAHALDFDDIHHRMGGHPSSPILSALLPVGEDIGASGPDLLRAFVLGAELEIALADVLNPGHYERGWHPTAVLGTLGAAYAVADLLDLDVERRQHALGIAASHAGGIKGNFGSMTKPLHVGSAARNGIEAARLAEQGFTASPDILEREFGGFCDLFQGDTDVDFTHLDHLGDPWGLLDPPVGFKPYPCCGSTHSAIDAALQVRAESGIAGDGTGTGISPTDIESVTIREHPRRLDHTDTPDPRTALDGKFSVQYCVAVALLDGDVWIDHFDEEMVMANRYRAVLEKIHVERDRETFEAREWGATVRLETKGDTGDADTRTITIDAPTGSASNPMTDDDLDEKFRRCATEVLAGRESDGTPDGTEQLGDGEALDETLWTLRNLETVDDVGAVIEQLQSVSH